MGCKGSKSGTVAETQAKDIPPSLLTGDVQGATKVATANDGSVTVKYYKFCSIHPYFTVVDHAAAKPIMDEFVEKTKAETGCCYYGWTLQGDKLFCREAYTDGDAVLAHLKNVGECIEKLLAGPAKLDSIEIHGPASELAKVKEATEKLGTEYFEIDSGISFMAQETEGGDQPQTLCSIQPYFTVLDKDMAKPIMGELVQQTKSETGCVYYGWTAVGNKLFCREAYVDGAAVLAHLQNVDVYMKKILAEGVAKLDRIEIHGPADELEKVKGATETLGTKYFAVVSGFQKYKK